MSGCSGLYKKFPMLTYYVREIYKLTPYAAYIVQMGHCVRAFGANAMASIFYNIGFCELGLVPLEP